MSSSTYARNRVTDRISNESFQLELCAEGGSKLTNLQFGNIRVAVFRVYVTGDLIMQCIAIDQECVFAFDVSQLHSSTCKLHLFYCLS